MNVTQKGCLIHHKNLTLRKALYRLFKIINSTIAPTKQLTEAEIKVYSEFLLLPQKFKFATFNSIARKKVAQNYNKFHDRDVQPKTISSYVIQFVEKRFITRDEDGVNQVPPKFRKLVDYLIQAISNGKSYIIQIKLDAQGSKIYIQPSSKSSSSRQKDDRRSN